MRRFASLRRAGDFARLRRRGRRTVTDNLTFFREEASAGERPLVGITVSKAVGKAVVRNSVRRRLAAAIHESLPDGAAMRLLVVPRPSAAAAPFAALRSEVRRALAL